MNPIDEMTMYSDPALRASIQKVREHAMTLAGAFHARTADDNATDVDRIQAGSADLIIELAEKKASLIDREEAERRREDFEAWSKTNMDEFVREVADLVTSGIEDIPGGPIEMIRNKMLTNLDARLAKFVREDDEHVFSVWQEAVNSLIALGIPDGILSLNKTGGNA